MLSLALGQGQAALAQSATQQAPVTQPATTQPQAPTHKSRSPQPGFTLEDRRDFYEQAKLSHTRAALYSLALPGLGNIYTDQAFSGALLMTLYGMGWLMIGYGLLYDKNEQLIIGSGVAVTSMGVAQWMSYRGVAQYNQALKVRYQLAPLSLSSGRPGLSLALWF